MLDDGTNTFTITYTNLDLTTIDDAPATNRVFNFNGATETIGLSQSTAVKETLSGIALADSGGAASLTTVFADLVNVVGAAFANGDVLNILGTDADGSAVSTSFTITDVNATTVGALVGAINAAFGASTVDLVNGVIRVSDDHAGRSVSPDLALSITSDSANGGNTEAAPLGLFDILVHGNAGGDAVTIDSGESVGVTFADLAGSGSVTINGEAGDGIEVASGENVTIEDADFLNLGAKSVIDGTLTVDDGAGGTGTVTLADGAALSGEGTVNAAMASFLPVAGGTVTDNSSPISVSTNGDLLAAVNFGATDQDNNGVTFVTETTESGTDLNGSGIDFTLNGSGNFAVGSNEGTGLFEENASYDGGGNLALTLDNLDPTKTYEIEVLHGSAAIPFVAGPMNVAVYDGTTNSITTADAARGSSVTAAPTNPVGDNGTGDQIPLANIGSNGGTQYAVGDRSPVPAPGGGDSYAVFLTGYLKIDNTSNPGNQWTFGTFSDDNSRIRIDLNQNGILEGDLTGEGGIGGETVVYQPSCCNVVLGNPVTIPRRSLHVRGGVHGRWRRRLRRVFLRSRQSHLQQYELCVAGRRPARYCREFNGRCRLERYLQSATCGCGDRPNGCLERLHFRRADR